MLGAAPVLYAWPTLLLEPTSAIIAQWVGFTALWGLDQYVSYFPTHSNMLMSRKAV